MLDYARYGRGAGLWIGVAALLAAVGLSGCGGVRSDQQVLESAAEDALTEARDDINESAEVADGFRVGILPLVEKDGSNVTDALKVFAGESKLRVFARSEAEWNQILTEAEFGTLREDLMNPKTVVTADRLQQLQPIEGLEGVLLGEVLDHSVGELEGRVRVRLFLFDVESGEQLWEGEFTGTAPRSAVDVARPYWRYVIYAGIALLALAIAIRLIKAASRPR